MVKAAKEILQQLHLLAADAAALKLIPCWQQALVNCSAYLREQQELNNMLGFDDLKRGLGAFKNNRQVCSKNSSRYQYIMVDEFQDTNERQENLFVAVRR
ncbi:MAG: UvrD-helicase domain-containing protein [Phascolarctobacterium faecium]